MPKIRGVMKTFKWCVQTNPSTDNQPRVTVIKFGDGYEQRVKDGINNNLRSHSVSLVMPREEGRRVDAFLTEHGGLNAFLWKEPTSHKTVKVVCRSWKTQPNHTTMSITATFEEVVV